MTQPAAGTLAAVRAARTEAATTYKEATKKAAADRSAGLRDALHSLWAAITNGEDRSVAVAAYKTARDSQDAVYQVAVDAAGRVYQSSVDGAWMAWKTKGATWQEAAEYEVAMDVERRRLTGPLAEYNADIAAADAAVAAAGYKLTAAWRVQR